MRGTLPVLITPARLFASTASEIHAPAAWSAGTGYGFGAIVSVAADYTIYESLEAGNLGNTPNQSPLSWRALGPTETAYAPAKTNYALGETCSFARRCYESLVLQAAANPLPVWPETETAFWIDAGPTNKWAMFDLNANTQTVVASPLTVVFSPGQRINTCGLSGMIGNQVQVSATSALGGGVIYPNASTKSPTGVFDLNTRVVMNGYDYAFEPFSTRPSNVIFDIPPYSDAVVTVTISSTSGNVKCGSCLVGTFVYMGEVQYRAKADALNFSTIERDKYGGALLIPRPGVPKSSQTLVLPSALVNKVRDFKTLSDARPVLYTALDDAASHYFEMLQIVGIWKTFDITADNFGQALINLDLEQI